jgi:hypothetical protein
MAVDDSAPQAELSKRDRKRQLRLFNEAEKRLEAILSERPHRPGFDHICPLCPGDSYFNRNGLLLHL